MTEELLLGALVGAIVIGALFGLFVAWLVISAISDAEDRWSRRDHE